MSRFLNTRLLYVLLTIVIIIALFVFFFKRCSSKKEVLASITSTTVVVGEPIAYSDSTRDVKIRLWEFGNGDVSDKRQGTYSYNKIGRYKIRLTVDNETERYFDITVKEKSGLTDGQFIRIVGPREAIQYENIVFRGEGNAEQWRWEFGESGMVDSRTKSTIYSYSEPGIYEILLTTENTQYPIRQTIEIVPMYSEADSTDVTSLIGQDIKEKLQSIADRRGHFNTHYNHIIQEYLGGKENVLVLVNNTKQNDIYSYCQGLRMAGKAKTIIKQVMVDIPDLSTGYVTQIIVIQQDQS